MADDTDPKLSPTWEPEPTFERLDRCRAMLAIHGYLTDVENGRVKRRIDKERSRAGQKHAKGA